MVDHEAVVEISTGGSSYKISGSEAFVEKMIALLPNAFPMHASGDVSRDDDSAEKQTSKNNASVESLDDFVTRVKMTDDLADGKKVAAFIVFLTEVAGSAPCSVSDIEGCFDYTGLKTPRNLKTVISNITRVDRGSYIRSVTRGQYAPTTNGKNLVKELAKS